MYHSFMIRYMHVLFLLEVLLHKESNLGDCRLCIILWPGKLNPLHLK